MQGHKRSYPTSSYSSALNATQGYNPSYPTSSYSSVLNATQGFNPSYPTSYILIPNDVDDPVL